MSTVFEVIGGQKYRFKLTVGNCYGLVGWNMIERSVIRKSG